MAIKKMEIAASAVDNEARKFEGLMKKIGRKALIGYQIPATISLKAMIETFIRRGYTEGETQGQTTVLVNKALGVSCNLGWFKPVGKWRVVTAYFNKVKKLTQPKQVALNNLYIVQDNSDLDQKWINNLAKRYAAGEEPEPVHIVPMTTKIRKDLARMRAAFIKENSPHKDIIPVDILTTKKKAILLDGNHRYLAARKAGLRSLPYDESARDAVADDVVTMMVQGYL